MKPREYRAALAAHVERTPWAQRKAGRGIQLLRRGNTVWIVRAGASVVAKFQRSWSM